VVPSGELEFKRRQALDAASMEISVQVSGVMF